MKIRQGFVANSSTCSFLILGWYVNMDGIEISDKLGIDCNKLWESNYHINADGNHYVGYVLANFQSYMEEKIVNFDEVLEKVEKIREMFNLDEDPKIYGGIYGC